MGAYTDMDAVINLSPRSDKSWGQENLSVVRGDTVRAFYPAGSASPTVATNTGAPRGGGQRLWYFPKPVEEAAIEYDATFPAGFDPVKGGKMGFGMWGGNNFDGGKRPDGTDGVSCRIMWRADENTNGLPDLEAYMYAYAAPPGSIDTGKGFSVKRGAFDLTPGVAQRFGIGMRLNTPGYANGKLAITMNGQRVIYATDVVYRTVDTLKLEGIILSTFFGGGTEEWVTPVDTWAEFSIPQWGHTSRKATVGNTYMNDGRKRTRSKGF